MLLTKDLHKVNREVRRFAWLPIEMDDNGRNVIWLSAYWSYEEWALSISGRYKWFSYVNVINRNQDFINKEKFENYKNPPRVITNILKRVSNDKPI